MNEDPPDQPEEADELYRRASALDTSRPSELVRHRVLKHAAQLAEDRRAHDPELGTPAQAHRPWRQPAIVGTLAAAALAGLLITPRFLTPTAPPPTASSSAPSARLSELPSELPIEQPSAPPLAPSAPLAPPGRSDAPLAPARAPRMAARAPMTAPVPMATPAPMPLAPMAPPGHSDAQMAATGATPMAPAPPAADVVESQPQSNIVGKQNPAGNQFVGGARSRAAAGDAGEAETPANAAPSVTAERRSLDPAAQLRRAAEIGDVAKLQMLLDQQPVIEARDADGRTALMLAAQHGQSLAVDVLLAHGADPNAADAHGATPLQAALAAHEPAIAAALRRAGAQ